VKGFIITLTAYEDDRQCYTEPSEKMEDITIPTEIAKSATACKEVLDTHASKDHAWIRSAQFDFNFWCSVIKATSLDKSGLDYILRDYPDERESICNLLDALKTCVEGAVRIYDGTGMLPTSKIISVANSVTQRK
jgi:hypothetical protein